MSSYCKFLAIYNTDLSVAISETTTKSQRLVTAKLTVEFNKPVHVEDKHHHKHFIPHDHIPCHPSKVGQIILARLTYYVNDGGNWLFNTTNLIGRNAANFSRTINHNRVTETWTFVFKLPLNTQWDSFRGQFKLNDIYEDQYSYAECAYYKSANILVYNGDDISNPQGCKDLIPWEPTNTELPDQNYAIIQLNQGDLFGMRYPAEIKTVEIAPPEHEIPYLIRQDYDGCFRNNVVQLSFMEPGIYGIRTKFQGGSDTRFFSVGAQFANNVGPFNRMVALPLPIYSTNFAYSTKPNYSIFQAANQFIPDLHHADTETIVNDLNNYQGNEPLNLIICGDGDAGEVFIGDENWFMDANCLPSLSLKRFLAAAHGCVRTICILNPLVAVGLSSSCHLMKYMATALEASSPYNPYGSPYRPPLDYATICAYDVTVAIVQPGTNRNGYFCHSQTGSIQEITAYPGAGLTALASGRESTKEKPSFYNKLSLV